MNLTRKQLTTIVVASLTGAAMLLVAWLTLFQPQVAKIESAKTAVAEQEQITASLKTELKQLEAKRDDIDTAKADASTLYAQFPTVSDQAAWIAMINTAASEAGVTADAISPSVPAMGSSSATTPGAPAAAAPAAGTAAATPAPVAPTDGAAPADGAAAAAPVQNLATIAVTLSVSGSDAAIRTFLEKVEGLQQPLLVDEFAITASADTLTANITGRTFLMRPVPEPTLASE